MKKILFLALLTFAINFTQAQSNLLNQGKDFFFHDDYLGALTSFQKATFDSTFNRQPEVYLWLARICFILLDYEEASKNVNFILTNFPNSTECEEAIYWQARVLHMKSEYEKAHQVLTSFLKSYPNSRWSSNAIFWMAEASFELKSYDKAGPLYAQIIQDFPASDKVALAYHRLKIIELRQREEELIKLLRWSHNETLNTSEEFQNKEKAYQQSIQAYQERILELTQSQKAEVKASVNFDPEANVPSSFEPSTQPVAGITPSQPVIDDTLLQHFRQLRAQIVNLRKSYSDYLNQKSISGK